MTAAAASVAARAVTTVAARIAGDGGVAWTEGRQGVGVGDAAAEDDGATLSTRPDAATARGGYLQGFLYGRVDHGGRPASAPGGDTPAPGGDTSARRPPRPAGGRLSLHRSGEAG
eukprot:TRINITY_DN44_c1_g1_i9.p3 TRINITY_DN44_c1_g1~~TRINITY_DN44_c1_g1_i9.p3  ORF type:complete len:115 (-),score=4.00 TRINITY_DN44_c1_g1_i9:112-456(-)